MAAASDLARLEEPLAGAWQRASGMRARFTLGSSGMLARQIRNGAPYDVYLSANEQFVADLAAGGEIQPASLRVYAVGRLALWSPGHKLRSLADLTLPEVRHIAIANPAHAPYGVAAKQVLQTQGLWPAAAEKIVLAENVRQTLQFAASGNADAALTAWSLVFDQGGVLLPAHWHSPIRQAGGVLTASGHPAAAQQFLDFLGGADGQAILRSYGLFPAE